VITGFDEPDSGCWKCGTGTDPDTWNHTSIDFSAFATLNGTYTLRQNGCEQGTDGYGPSGAEESACVWRASAAKTFTWKYWEDADCDGGSGTNEDASFTYDTVWFYLYHTSTTFWQFAIYLNNRYLWLSQGYAGGAGEITGATASECHDAIVFTEQSDPGTGIPTKGGELYDWCEGPTFINEDPGYFHLYATGSSTGAVTVTPCA
jgi:hypothetical protein